MAFILQGHGRKTPKSDTQTTDNTETTIREAPPVGGDISTSARADFGYFFPQFNNATNYLPANLQTIEDLDKLGELMILDKGNEVEATPDSALMPVLTYWGQFLDHELTAGTDRDSKQLTGIADESIEGAPAVHPPVAPSKIESELKNIRSPRFDLDSVYGGDPLGNDIPPILKTRVAALSSAMRDPDDLAKMRVGEVVEPEGITDGLGSNRDLPRFDDVDDTVHQALIDIAAAQGESIEPEKLKGKALIGDMRNDENLIIAQFHLSFLHFHNQVVDHLRNTDTGWIADFHSAQQLTRLHYQWLIVEGYLKSICDPDVVDKIIQDKAAHFFAFRDAYEERQAAPAPTESPKQADVAIEEAPQTEGINILGNTMPLEFSVAAFRFGHTMVRDSYDYNETFGRPNGEASFSRLFAFTGEGGFFDKGRLPGDWIIDWSRFVGIDPADNSDGGPARQARSIDTALAPPLKDMTNAAGDFTGDLRDLFIHLARRNLRRGYNMQLVTGQALHQYLQDEGALNSGPIADVSTLFEHKPELQDFLKNSDSDLHEQTPLWFYILAEAEANGAGQPNGNSLGQLGSWLVASTFIGVLLSDPDSALSRGFHPDHSPLRLADDKTITTIEDWMRFAGVMS